MGSLGRDRGIIAAAVMALSSVSVIGNALRLRRADTRRPRPTAGRRNLCS
jgi:cation transport ATPase